MRALVPIAIILVTAVAVVVGGNAVIGDDNSDTGPHAAVPATPDPCDLEPPTGKEVVFYPLECITYHGQPDKTPRGWKPHPPCPDDLREEEPDLCDNGEKHYVPDFGPRVRTVTVNGEVIELPEGVKFGYAEPSGVRTITIGDSWVKYVSGYVNGTGKDVLRAHELGPEDAQAIQPIVDALAQE